jgi:hypothetical protein
VSIVLDIQTVSIAIASASVVAGVIYYALQIRHQNKMRQTDLVMRLYATFSSNEFQDAWVNVVNSPNDAESYDNIGDLEKKVRNREVNQLCLFFEGIGILLQRKLLDTKMVEDLFGGSVARAWEKVKTAVTKGRKKFGDPTIYYYFENLYYEMKKREQQR